MSLEKFEVICFNILFFALLFGMPCLSLYFLFWHGR